LEAGKHVWIEKPLATSLVQGRELVQLAQDKGRVLFVDHTFLYDPLVQRIRRLIADGELGDIYHVYFQRLNLGRIKRDSNVWWNSAPHDVSLLLYLSGAQPASVTLHGYRYLQSQVEDLNMGVIEMRGGASAFIYHNWLFPENTARLTVVGSRKLLTYEGKFDKRAVTVYEYAVDHQYRSGSDLPTTIPSRFTRWYNVDDVSDAEPLASAAEDFIGSIREARAPLSDGKFSLQVLAVLEAGEASLRSGGAKISL
jgi:predicted dehydrogenase